MKTKTDNKPRPDDERLKEAIKALLEDLEARLQREAIRKERGTDDTQG